MSWRRVAEIAIDAGVDRRTLALLAEAVFAYIDELTALSAEGYAEEQSVAAGETQRRRRRVAELLLEPDPDEDSVRDAAADAGWTPPTEIAALVWADGGRRVRARSAGGGARGRRRGYGRRDGARRRSRRAGAPRSPRARGAWDPCDARPHGAPARGGDQRRPRDEPADADRRRVRRGLGPRRLQRAPRNLATHGDPAVLRDLAESRLAPLESETPASRERLTATLRAWLDHQGEVSRVAAELHVHPQTVRYRLGRLHELFGEALATPSGRFELAGQRCEGQFRGLPKRGRTRRARRRRK